MKVPHVKYDHAVTILAEAVGMGSWADLFAGRGTKTVRALYDMVPHGDAAELLPERRDIVAEAFPDVRLVSDYQKLLGGSWDVVSCDPPFLMGEMLGCRVVFDALRIARKGLVCWLPQDIPLYCSRNNIDVPTCERLVEYSWATFGTVSFTIAEVEAFTHGRVLAVNDPMTGVAYYAIDLR